MDDLDNFVPFFENITVGEYIKIWRFEYWKWFLPHENYDPINHGRLHLFGKLYFRIKNVELKIN